MINEERDVVLDEVKEKEEKLVKILTKICEDFKINNHEEVIKCFLNNRRNYKNNNKNLTIF